MLYNYEYKCLFNNRTFGQELHETQLIEHTVTVHYSSSWKYIEKAGISFEDVHTGKTSGLKFIRSQHLNPKGTLNISYILSLLYIKVSEN